jgi:hypothetical protein
VTDGELLQDYLSRQDETALAALVRRHGPMVYGMQYDAASAISRILKKNLLPCGAGR